MRFPVIAEAVVNLSVASTILIEVTCRLHQREFDLASSIYKQRRIRKEARVQCVDVQLVDPVGPRGTVPIILDARIVDERVALVKSFRLRPAHVLRIA